MAPHAIFLTYWSFSLAVDQTRAARVSKRSTPRHADHEQQAQATRVWDDILAVK
jgi:hypothetical protein